MVSWNCAAFGSKISWLKKEQEANGLGNLLGTKIAVVDDITIPIIFF